MPSSRAPRPANHRRTPGAARPAAPRPPSDPPAATPPRARGAGRGGRRLLRARRPCRRPRAGRGGVRPGRGGGGRLGSGLPARVRGGLGAPRWSIPAPSLAAARCHSSIRSRHTGSPRSQGSDPGGSSSEKRTSKGAQATRTRSSSSGVPGSSCTHTTPGRLAGPAVQIARTDGISPSRSSTASKRGSSMPGTGSGGDPTRLRGGIRPRLRRRLRPLVGHAASIASGPWKTRCHSRPTPLRHRSHRSGKSGVSGPTNRGTRRASAWDDTLENAHARQPDGGPRRCWAPPRRRRRCLGAAGPPRRAPS